MFARGDCFFEGLNRPAAACRCLGEGDAARALPYKPTVGVIVGGGGHDWRSAFSLATETGISRRGGAGEGSSIGLGNVGAQPTIIVVGGGGGGPCPTCSIPRGGGPHPVSRALLSLWETSERSA